MDFSAFLEELRASPEYADQIVHVREVPARPAEFGEVVLPEALRRLLRARGVERLYSHQARALELLEHGRDVLIGSGTASGKSLCYQLPILRTLLEEPRGTALLLYPTKALCQDQFRAFEALLKLALPGSEGLAGVYDGDTSSDRRKALRDHGRVVFTNPDMVHAALMAQHARWSGFLSQLRWLVLDELHSYTGIFGSNMALLLRRLERVFRHYGSIPQLVACTATLANPVALAERLTTRRVALVDGDGSPRGKRTYVFWNPPRERATPSRSRRSANVEAHTLMAELVRRGVATITFSKAKLTAEMVNRYVVENLRETAPGLASKVAPYRGGYLPQERREIERRLFEGKLMGVSTTRALELGIDVGVMDAAILVGYPGTVASFLQQSGRAGRREREALCILIGLDTPINQYVLNHPEYVFERPLERGVIDPFNPFVLAGHLRCAAQEMPLEEGELGTFGPHAELCLRVLGDNLKVRRIGDRWYHAASEVPQHEVPLRSYADQTVTIQERDTGRTLGEMNKFDAPPILHPEAVYLHQGDTYRVLDLDLTKNLCLVVREEIPYYTQPLGGTDIHHIDHTLRQKPLGSGTAFWGEVTVEFKNGYYERVHFYSVETLSCHNVKIPPYYMDTMAMWVVPPEELMDRVTRAGWDPKRGLRAIGYATRMILPLWVTCDTPSFSHSVGCMNSPWSALFFYERYPLGLGFTWQAYEVLPQVLNAVRTHLRECSCKDGCPRCTGKPLRQYATWNVERGEGSIPSKAAALMILDGLLGEEAPTPPPEGDGSSSPGTLDAAGAWSALGPRAPLPDETSTLAAYNGWTPGDEARLEQALRRRLERMREPQVQHPILPAVETAYPEPESAQALGQPDVSRRADRRRQFNRDLRKRLDQRLAGLAAHDAPAALPPAGTKPPPLLKPPTPKPAPPESPVPPPEPELPPAEDATPCPDPPPARAGDPLAARARRLARERRQRS
ncbi:MAG TPA: DEAD/DEAH box helicase [Armatimonadota bacterium]